MQKIRHTDFTYFFIFTFYLVLNRIDALVCPPLESISYSHIFSWWTLMSLTVIVVALLLYCSCGGKQGLWYMLFFLMLYVGGLLDALYVLNVPFPEMWLNPNFIHYWHPAYIFFRYPWTIKEQTIYWAAWTAIISITYKFFRRKHQILKFGLKNT